MQFAGGGEGVAEGAVDPDTLAGFELAEAIGAGADALDQEVEADAACRRPALGDRECARQERASTILLPVTLRGQHVELARLGLGSLAIDQREEAIPTRRTALGDLTEPSAERCRHRGCLARSRP